MWSVRIESCAFVLWVGKFTTCVRCNWSSISLVLSWLKSPQTTTFCIGKECVLLVHFFDDVVDQHDGEGSAQRVVDQTDEYWGGEAGCRDAWLSESFCICCLYAFTFSGCGEQTCILQWSSRAMINWCNHTIRLLGVVWWSFLRPP